MPDFQIKKVNNATRKYTLENKEGHSVTLVLPEEHVSTEQKNSYLHGHAAGHLSGFNKAKRIKWISVGLMITQLLSLGALIWCLRHG